MMMSALPALPLLISVAAAMLSYPSLGSFSSVRALSPIVLLGPSPNGLVIGPRRRSLAASARSSHRDTDDETVCGDDDGRPPIPLEWNRRDATVLLASGSLFLTGTAAAPLQARADIEGVVAPPPPSAAVPVSGDDGGGVTLYKTKSGLKYVELRAGTGLTPRYGQLVSVSYKAYIKLPDVKGEKSQLQQFDADKGFLIKHGNGRCIPGLDEGIHTMRVGGKRRIIIPPKLGYVTSGLGPLPETSWGRWKLNRLLDKMVEVRGGNVVFDVELRSAIDDEADQGYYTDESLSPEEFGELRNNLERSAREAKAAKQKFDALEGSRGV